MFLYPDALRTSYMMDNPPVVRVVVQVVYPPSARLGTSEGVAEVQERLADTFELQQRQPQIGLQISFGAMPGMLGGTGLVFAHPDGYELTVGQDSVALAIDQRYRDRARFSTLLEPALAAVGSAGRLKDYVRIGVRYINAAPATIAQFRDWFKPEFVGWAGGDLVSADADRTWVLITQIFRTDPASPITNGAIRYGFLQHGVGLDITNSEAANAPSFIADLDLGDQRSGSFDATALTDKFRVINHEIAAFFENSMTEAGIAHFALRAKEA